MRFLLLVNLVFVSCRSTDIEVFNLMEKTEVMELTKEITDFRVNHGAWPTVRQVETKAKQNVYLRRFDKLKFQINPDSSLDISCRLQFDDFEDRIRRLDFKQKVEVPDSNGRYTSTFEYTNLILQGDIELGTRKELTSKERRKVKAWDKLKRSSRVLQILQTKTKQTYKLNVGSHISIFSSDNSLVMIQSDSGYERAQWTLTSINRKDSTLSLDIWGPGTLKRQVRLNEIDSIVVSNKKGIYKIIGITDTAPL